MPATREELERYVTYVFDGPRLNKDVPPAKVQFGQYSRLSGIDGRFPGCLRKYYGNRLLVDLSGVSGLTSIADETGVSFIQEVIFQKRGTSTTYRGFVIRWDASGDTDNEAVGLVYTSDGGSTWAYLAIWSGASTAVTSTTMMEAATEGAYLMVSVDGKSTKTVYWSGSALVAVDSGPGAFVATLAAMTKASEAEDTSYFLQGDGVYQVRYRLYSSTRGIYSAMSSPVTVFLDQPKLAKASGTIYLSSYGGDSGLLVDGDVITVGGRTFEADDDSSITSDVTIDITGLTTIAQMCQAIADAINSDTDNCGCTARAASASVYIEASEAGTDGNAIDLSVTETGASTDDVTVSGTTLTGGGVVTNEYIQQCKVTLDFPAHGSVLASYDYDDFSALFDTVDIFRTIDLGQVPAAQQGAIFYNEQSIAKTGNWATSGAWDALQVSIGTVPDTALVLLDQYDPSTDSAVAPPASGTIARYQGMTLMAQASSDDNPFDILASSLSQQSPEYFTTYNERSGNSTRGRCSRFIVAGDSCFALHPSGFVHIYKSSGERPVQFVDTINGIGLDGKWAAHLLGNGVLMICSGLLRQMGGNDGNVVDVAGASRLLADDWADDIANYVSSGYDARLNCSMFLDSQRAEILCLWHGTGGISMLEGANFAWMTSGPDITDGQKHRAYFVTTEGLILSPDYAKAGSGTMFDLSDSYTLAGSATGGSDSTLVSDGATFHADMVGAMLYMIDGENAGQGRRIQSVNVGTYTITVSPAFSASISYGDKFAISPVPMHIVLSGVKPMDAAQPLVAFDRQKMAGIAIKFNSASGTVAGITDGFRAGAYADSTALNTETAELLVSTTLEEATAAFEHVVSGIDVLPYLEYIGVGSDFEITDVQVLKTETDSKAVT